MGRATSGVTGMKFRDDDSLLSMTVILAGADHEGEGEEDDDQKLYVFTVTDGGYAKKTRIGEYRLQGRGGLGIKAMQITESRGELVGGLVLRDTDDVLSVTESGQITRSLVSGVPVKGRGTMGVSFVKFKGNDRVVTIARNTDLTVEDSAEETDEEDGKKKEKKVVGGAGGDRGQK